MKSPFFLLPVLCLCLSGLIPTATQAEQIEITGPANSVSFGTFVATLPNGNIVVTDPNYGDGVTSNLGAVYLYTPTGELISRLTGSTSGDHVGDSPDGVLVLTNGNFVVQSIHWQNAPGVNVGAVTWVNGATGRDGPVSATNSWVGAKDDDMVGGSVVGLPNGHYVVINPYRNANDIADVGSVTWSNGLSGGTGVLSVNNSLVGSATNDRVGEGGITILTNGNYVVKSAYWRNGDPGAGAATWGNGASGVRGIVNPNNSIVGDYVGDFVGTAVVALTNGNYVVSSPFWSSSNSVGDAGAATWGNGRTGSAGVVSNANSLIGLTTDDGVGTKVYALTNGNYVVASPSWSYASFDNAGAVTWGNGVSGTFGIVSANNSLIGSKADDLVGNQVTALSNGNYVINSASWSSDVLSGLGAVTWCNGSVITSGFVTLANSLTGTRTNDHVGSSGVYALTNGNYVVCSSAWSNEGLALAGAATWLSGTAATFGKVTITNSLVGGAGGNRVGNGGVTPLTNGNYVVISELWDNGGTSNAGAITWGPGATGIKGVAVTSGNSLVGSTVNDHVGSSGVTPLTNGNYVVSSPEWNNGTNADAGAVTWGNGLSALTGVVSTSNSLVGTTASDHVGDNDVNGGSGVTALTDGNYVVSSPRWDNDTVTDAGALTWGNGVNGAVKGAVSATNSIVGSHELDRIGSAVIPAHVKIFANGSYISMAPFWNSDIGAATLGAPGGGIVGSVTTDNSVTSETVSGGDDLVAAYNASWKQMVVGQPGINEVTLFSFPAPQVTVEQPVGSPLLDAGSADFGTLLTGQNATLSFTVTNTSGGILSGLTLVKGGPNAAEFTAYAFPTTLANGASTTFTVKFAPTKAGDRRAYLHISSNVRTQSSFDIVLEGTAVTPVVPVVKTLPATNIDFTSATLNGTVNAKEYPRDIKFEYGISSAYGTSVSAAPPTLDTNVVTPVNVQINGLLPHTKYHFRVKAVGFYGSANGSNLTFTTDNHAPVAAANTYAILPGARATLDVLANDTDGDGDTLSIASFTKLSNPAAGKLTKTGATLLFTASNTFTGPVTFSYTASDGFGKTATALVTLNSGSFTSIDPVSKNMPSAADDYNVNVVATGAWSAVENLSWVTVSPAYRFDSGPVTISLQPNKAKTSRSGIITIAGVAHDITQEGVVLPSIEVPLVIPPAVVGDPYSVTIVTHDAPVTYTVTNLPAGLKIDQATGIISGTPTKGIPYLVTVSAKNAAGPAPASISFTIDVKPINPGIVGTFHGLIDRNADLNSNFGSRIEVTTTSLGAYTGKIISGAVTTSIKGRVITFPADLDHAMITLTIPRKLPLTDLDLVLNFEGPDNIVSGTLEDQNAHVANITAWRNTWNATNKATAYATLHNFSLEQPIDSDTLPEGYGFGSFKVKDTTGALTAAGQLADGTKFTSTTFVGPEGEVLVYQSLYSKRGSLAGILTITTNGTPAQNDIGLALGDSFDWLKPGPATPTAKDLIYRDGFGPIDLIPQGAAYVPIAKGAVVMGLPNSADNAQLDFSEGTLDPEFHIDFDLLNPSAAGLTNKATLPTFASGLNPYKVTLPTVTPATGVFTGNFTLPAALAKNVRKVTFQGLIVRHGATTKGYGYFLLPQLPLGSEAITATPKHSGRVILQAKP